MPTPAPFAGTLVWLWNLPNCDGGDPARIVARLSAAGCQGALIKATDGGNGYNDWNAIRVLAAALRAAGLAFLTWGYCYDYAEPAEAQAAISAIQQLAPDAHVLDVEQEDEDQLTAAADAIALTTAVQRACPGVPLAYAPLPAIALHLRLPYRQFADAGLTMLPQLYYTALGWTPQHTFNQFYAAAHQYQLTANPICPAYEDAPRDGAAATEEDVVAAVALARYCGCPGQSIWSYDSLDDAGWQRVRLAATLFAQQPATTADQQLATVTSERDALQAVLDAVRAAVARV